MVRVDELGQEREEEQRRLRVEDVDDDALGEVAAPTPRGSLRIAVVRIGAAEQRPDPDHDQVQRPQRLHDSERGRRRHEDRREPEGREREVHERPDWIPSTDASPAPRP